MSDRRKYVVEVEQWMRDAAKEILVAMDFNNWTVDSETEPCAEIIASKYDAARAEGQEGALDGWEPGPANEHGMRRHACGVHKRYCEPCCLCSSNWHKFPASLRSPASTPPDQQICNDMIDNLRHNVGEQKKRLSASTPPTYDQLLTCLRNYAEAQKACGNPARLQDLREYRNWKNMPQDGAYDEQLLTLINGASTPPEWCSDCHHMHNTICGCNCHIEASTPTGTKE